MSFEDDHKTETYKSLISISTEAFKALQYLNGGSVVAIMTFIGHTDTFSKQDIYQAKCPLLFFIIGLVFATSVFITAYLTQLTLHNENIEKTTKGKHMLWLGMSLILCILSLAFFCLGAFSALNLLAITR